MISTTGAARPTPEPPAPESRSGCWFKCLLPPPFIFAILFFCFLLYLDFPKPFGDDLYYIGAGLHLAQGGDFSNPLLQREGYPAPHHYFGHPPLFSYVLAGWLKIFGISAWSFKLFQLLMYLIICRATLTLLRRHQSPGLLEWLLPFVVASTFMSIGLRFEPLSIALTMSGFVLAEAECTGLTAIFLGFLLMFLGASTASRVTFFSAALVLLAAVNLWRRKVPAVKIIGFAGLALAIAFGGFLLMIGFHLGEFWKGYLFVAGGRSGGPLLEALKHYLFHIQGVTWLPIQALWLVFLPFFWKMRDRKLAQIGLFVSAPIFLLLFMGALNDGAIWYIFLAVLVAVIGWSKQFKRFPALAIQLVFAGAVLIANARYGLSVIGLLTGNIEPGHIENLDEARALKSTPGHVLLIDQETARYVFDYRLPEGCLDWNYATPYPGSLATESPPQPGDVYLVGPTVVDLLNQKTSLKLALPKWKPGGLGRWACARFPEKAFIIAAKDCVISTNASQPR